MWYFDKKIITIVRVAKEIFIPRNEDDDFEKNVNSDLHFQLIQSTKR